MAFYLCTMELEQEALSAGTMSDPRRLMANEAKQHTDSAIDSNYSNGNPDDLKNARKTDFLVPFMQELFIKLSTTD